MDQLPSAGPTSRKTHISIRSGTYYHLQEVKWKFTWTKTWRGFIGDTHFTNYILPMSADGFDPPENGRISRIRLVGNLSHLEKIRNLIRTRSLSYRLRETVYQTKKEEFDLHTKFNYQIHWIYTFYWIISNLKGQFTQKMIFSDHLLTLMWIQSCISFFLSSVINKNRDI